MCQLDELPLVLTVEEFARVARLGRSAAYAAVRSGEVPGSFRLGRKILIPRSAVARLLGEVEAGPTSPTPRGSQEVTSDLS